MSATDFFYAQAGYSYDPATQTEEEGRLEGAKALAAAERERIELGYRVVWENDPDAESTFGDGEAEGYAAGDIIVLQGAMYNEGGEMLASIGGVGVKAETGLNDTYLRVCEAEMALEALA